MRIGLSKIDFDFWTDARVLGASLLRPQWTRGAPMKSAIPLGKSSFRPFSELL